MYNTNLVKMQSGELVDLTESIKSKEIVVIESIPINYGLSPRTNLIKMEDGRLVDFIRSVTSGELVEVNPTSLGNYSLAPMSDLIKNQNGSLVSFIETLLSITANPLIFRNLAYGQEVLTGGYFNKDGTVNNSTNFSRIVIPVESGKKYRMKATGLENITGFFCYFDAEGNALSNNSTAGAWEAVTTDSNKLQYRETRNTIPSGVTNIGMSFKSGEGHGQNLMVWEADDKYNPKPNDYYENTVILEI